MTRSQSVRAASVLIWLLGPAHAREADFEGDVSNLVQLVAESGNAVNAGPDVLGAGFERRVDLPPRRPRGRPFQRIDGRGNYSITLPDYDDDMIRQLKPLERTPEFFAISAKHSRAHLAGEPILRNTGKEATEILMATQPWKINLCALCLVGVIAMMTIAGAYMGSNYWIAMMLFSSYAILIPGLFVMDFEFEISFVVPDNLKPILQLIGKDLGPRIMVTRPYGQPGVFKESTRSVVPLLWQSGSHSGAFFVTIFAFVVPIMKLVMLALAYRWRNETDAFYVRCSRNSIQFVQLISKWAAPDMFGFMLLYFLCRCLRRPPMVESLEVLDCGFCCYTIFCVASVISTLGIRLPPSPNKAEAEAGWLAQAQQRLGKVGTMYVQLAFFVAWAAFFFVGLFTTTLKMAINMVSMKDEIGIPDQFMGVLVNILSQLHLNSELSLWSCGTTLFSWFCEEGEINLLIAFIMVMGFTLLVTVLDMLAAVTAAARATKSTGHTPRSPAKDEPLASPWRRLGAETDCPYMLASSILKHLSMLDVCCAGCILVTFIFQVYKRSGIELTLGPGIVYLAVSEVFHYLSFYWTQAMPALSGLKAIDD